VQLFKPIRYVFYRILTWKLNDPRESTPVLVATLGTSLLLFTNALLILMLYDDYSGREFLPSLHRTPRTYGVVAVLLASLAWPMYSAWVAKGNFAKLQREFETGARSRSSSRTIMFWSYIVLTVAVPLIYAIVYSSLRH
jgi:hypothetical protein